MANKPLYSTGNKPIYSIGNKPIYGDIVFNPDYLWIKVDREIVGTIDNWPNSAPIETEWTIGFHQYHAHHGYFFADSTALPIPPVVLVNEFQHETKNPFLHRISMGLMIENEFCRLNDGTNDYYEVWYHGRMFYQYNEAGSYPNNPYTMHVWCGSEHISKTGTFLSAGTYGSGPAGEAECRQARIRWTPATHTLQFI